jgi:hypothetical protein
MSDLNDDKKVNDLINCLIVASSRGNVKVKTIDSGLVVEVESVEYPFIIDFDPVTGFWFLED